MVVVALSCLSCDGDGLAEMDDGSCDNGIPKYPKVYRDLSQFRGGKRYQRWV